MKRQQQKAKTAIQFRVDDHLHEQIEEWRRQQPTIPPRSDALRELLRQALAGRQP